MAVIEVKYFNTFLIKKLTTVVDANPKPTPPYENVPTISYPATPASDWYVEESRIRGGYNNTTVDFGVKAYLDEENPLQQNRSSSLIYSGIFNSRTGVNNTNQFSVGEDITKSADPANGSIQKLYAEDTNLIIFQEDKVSRALIDKDAIYSAEGNPAITSTNLVIGQIIAYAGEYGISQDPFSFAVYGYRKYFTDKKRGTVLRLSQDGMTEISSYGMHDFFRDELANATKIVGGWDAHNKNYIISLQGDNVVLLPDGQYQGYATLSFDEGVLGWTSFYSYKPIYVTSLVSNFYSFFNGTVYLQNSGTYGGFYGFTYDSNVTLVLNSNPSVVKNFKTINYEGASGWELESMQGSSETGTTGDVSLPIAPFSTSGLSSLAGLESNLFALNFKRKENKFFANLQQALTINTTPQFGEVLYGEDISGIKGFFSTVKFKLNNANFPATRKELFSVSSDTVESSY
jgi:hypothetical protein